MKKQPLPLLLWIACIFAAFLLGLFIGRNQSPTAITVSVAASEPVSRTNITQTTLLVETSVPEETTVSYPININTASQEELELLPGIGPELAGRIITFRNANGRFSKPEELLNVEGIGPGRLESVLNLITTGGNSP